MGIAALRCDRALKNFKLNYFSIKGRVLIIFGCSLLPDIVLSWLTHCNGNLSDLERLIAETADRVQGYHINSGNTGMMGSGPWGVVCWGIWNYCP